jgi:hypothetical protein
MMVKNNFKLRDYCKIQVYDDNFDSTGGDIDFEIEATEPLRVAYVSLYKESGRA